MNSWILVSPINVFTKLAVALVVLVGVLCGAYAQELFSARSGIQHAGHFDYYRVDAKGKEWPVTIQFTAKPKNGTVTTLAFTRPASVNGEVKTVRAVKVLYQSKQGFFGEDNFTFRRITADPTDPDSGKEYTVAVTVR